MEYEKLIGRIANNYWILLSQEVDGDWTFLLWGEYPLSGSVGFIGEEDAKQCAVATVKQHLEEYGLKSELEDVLNVPWRVAMRYVTQQRAKVQFPPNFHQAQD